MGLKRIWLLAILFVTVCIVLVVGFLPTILSSSWGQARLVAYANQRIPGKVTARSVKLSWLGSQTLEGVTLHDPEGRTIASVESLKLESSLLRLLRTIPLKMKASLSGLNATIVSDAKGATNLQKALGLPLVSQERQPFVIQLKETSGLVLFSALDSPIKIHLAGKTLQDNLEGAFHIDTELSGFEPEKVHTLKAQLIHFPVALLDQFLAFSDPKLAGLVYAGLGDTLDATLEHVKSDQGVAITGHLETPTFQADCRGMLAKDTFTLTDPARLRLRLTKELMAQLASSGLAPASLNLEQSGRVELTIDTLSIPLSPAPALSKMQAGLQFNYQNRPVKISLQLNNEKQLDVMVTADPITLDLAEMGAISFNDLSLKLNGNALEFTTRLVPASTLAQYMGTSAELRVTSQMDGNYAIHDLQTSLKSDVADMQLNGRLQAGQFLVTSPATISYTLTPLLLQTLGIAEPIQASQPLRFTIEPTGKPIDHKDLSTLRLRGRLAIENLALGAPQSSMHASLNQLVIPWEIDAQANLISFSLTGQTAMGQEMNAGKLQGTILVTDWLSDGHPAPGKASVKANLTLSPLPIALVEAILAKPGLTLFLGQTLDVDLKANWAARDPKKSFVDIQLRGEQIKGNAALTIGDTIALKEGSPLPQFSVALTPERFNALRTLMLGETSGSVALVEPAYLNLTLSMLNLPLKSGSKGWADGALAAGLTLDKLRLSDRANKQTFELSAVQGRIDSKRIGQEIHFNLQGSQKDKSQLALDGHLTQLMSKDGSWNAKGMAVDASAHLKEFPASLVCRALNLDRSVRLKIEALLGPVIAADIKVQIQRLNGPVQIAAAGKNGTVQLDGQLSDGMLLLQKPFQMDVAVTPELGQGVLQDLVPLLSGIISSDDHLRLTIQPDGFALPFDFTNRSALQIGQMSLELGKMQFSNEGQFGKLLNLLHAQEQEVITVWFTPLYLSVANGVVSLQRFDMLLMQEYPIAAWGTIDLPGNWIDMMIGLSGRTLQKTVGLTTLDRNFMLQLPLRGEIGSAKIDRGKVAGKFAALAAQMQGTPQGLLLGTVLSVATGGGGLLDEKSPPPTTNPLPWETDAEGSNGDQASSDQEADNPVKMLQKGANSLLKNLFR